MVTDNFFRMQTESSAVKSAVVSKYFGAWTTIMLNNSRGPVAYIDLLSGPGEYADGSSSTPLLVLREATVKEELARRLVTVFNDEDNDVTTALSARIQAEPGVAQLAHAPIILSESLSGDLVRELRLRYPIPWLLFLDPWGYRGLSVELIAEVVEQWGCDCIFFFNYNRVNAGIDNPIVAQHMAELFKDGVTLARLQNAIRGKSVRERERIIVHELKSALQDSTSSRIYPVSLQFEDEQSRRCSHHLVFVSKKKKAYWIMKEIMLDESNHLHDGNGSFVFDPKRAGTYSLLGPQDISLGDLQSGLIEMFAGETSTFPVVRDRHDQGDNLYTKANYQEALLTLEETGRISIDPPRNKRLRAGRVTLGDKPKITFPPTR